MNRSEWDAARGTGSGRQAYALQARVRFRNGHVMRFGKVVTAPVCAVDATVGCRGRGHTGLDIQGPTLTGKENMRSTPFSEMSHLPRF